MVVIHICKYYTPRVEIKAGGKSSCLRQPNECSHHQRQRKRSATCQRNKECQGTRSYGFIVTVILLIGIYLLITQTQMIINLSDIIHHRILYNHLRLQIPK